MTADGRARAAQLWLEQRLADAGVASDVEYEFTVVDATDPDLVGPTLTCLAADGWRVEGFQYDTNTAFPSVAVLMFRTIPPLQKVTRDG